MSGKKPTDSFIARIDARIDERARRHTDEQIAATVAAAREANQTEVAAQIDRRIRSTVPGISNLRVKASGTAIVLMGSATDSTTLQRAGAIASEIAPFLTVSNFIVVTR
jgi:hypothetical protein